MFRFTVLLIFYIAISSCSRFRLMTYNIRNGKGMDNNADYNRTAAVIKNA